MKNNKGIAPLILILIVAGILILGGGGYYVVKKYKTPSIQPVGNQNQTSTQPVQDEMAGQKTYQDTTNGLEFQYPPTFSPSQRGEANGFVVALYSGAKALSDPNTLNSITIFALSANGATSFADYQAKHPINNRDTGRPIAFNTRTIGSNTFYYARTERFEGILSFDYYILHSDIMYRFVSVSRNVAWSDPNLDEENDPTHVTLKQILATLKFIPAATFTVNNTSTKSVAINDGGSIAIFWSSKNADKYPIFFTTTECLNPKMNKVDFLYGELSANGSDKFTIGGAQSSEKVIGCDFAFTYVAKNMATGEQASDTIHIKVNR